jgi:hypothetical protein
MLPSTWPAGHIPQWHPPPLPAAHPECSAPEYVVEPALPSVLGALCDNDPSRFDPALPPLSASDGVELSAGGHAAGVVPCGWVEHKVGPAEAIAAAAAGMGKRGISRHVPREEGWRGFATSAPYAPGGASGAVRGVRGWAGQDGHTCMDGLARPIQLSLQHCLAEQVVVVGGARHCPCVVLWGSACLRQPARKAHAFLRKLLLPLTWRCCSSRCIWRSKCCSGTVTGCKSVAGSGGGRDRLMVGAARIGHFAAGAHTSDLTRVVEERSAS